MALVDDATDAVDVVADNDEIAVAVDDAVDGAHSRYDANAAV